MFAAETCLACLKVKQDRTHILYMNGPEERKEKLKEMIHFYTDQIWLSISKDNKYHPTVENLFIRQIIHRKLRHL